MLNKIKKIFYRSIESKEILYTELENLMKENNAILIDVRSNQEYEEGHINGAINISSFNIEKEIKNVIKNKNDLIILYCSSGSRSKKAKKELEKLGYENVYNLKNGIDNIWIK